MFPISKILCGRAHRYQKFVEATDSTFLSFLAGRPLDMLAPTPESVRERLVQLVDRDSEIPAVGDGPGEFLSDADHQPRYRIVFNSPGLDEDSSPDRAKA